MTPLFNRYTLGILTVAIVAGTVWAKGNGAQNGISSAGPRIDVTALASSANIASLPMRQVEQPF